MSSVDRCGRCWTRNRTSIRSCSSAPCGGGNRRERNRSRTRCSAMRWSMPYPTEHGDEPDLERRILAAGDLRVIEGRKLRGHAIVFNKDSLDLGGFIERIRPEAV